MKTFLFLILLGMTVNANASVDLSCLADGSTKSLRTYMVQDGNNISVTKEAVAIDNSVTNIETIHLYTTKRSNDEANNTIYTGIAEKQIGPDVFISSDFQLVVPANLEKKVTLTFSQHNEVKEKLSLECTRPDYR